MIRKLAALLLCAVVFPAAVRGADMKAALRNVPADALLVAVVPSLQELDRDYGQAIKDLGLQEIVPPPFQSLVKMLRDQMPALEKMDETGPVVLAIMPASNLFELQQRQVLILPTKEPRTALEAMDAQPGDEGIWTLTFLGTPTLARAGEDHIMLAQGRSVLTDIAKAEKKLPDVLAAPAMETLQTTDIAIVARAKEFIKLVKPMIDMGMAQAMMQAAPGSLEAKQAQMSKEQFDQFLTGLDTVLLAMNYSEQGLGFRMYVSAQPNTEFAKQLKVVNTKESLLRGLPGGNYILAFGQVANPDASKTQIEEYIEPMFTVYEDVEGVDKDKLEKVKTTLADTAAMTRGMRAVVELLPPEKDGIFGVAAIVESTDSSKLVEHLETLFNTGRALFLGLDADDADVEELHEICNAFTYQREAEEVEGTKVHHYKFDVAQLDVMEQEDLQELQQVIGKDGLTVRVASADSKSTVMTFGGGKDYLGRLVQNVKGNEAPLEKTEGIASVSKQLPDDRNSVIFVAVDEVLRAVNRTMEALDEEPLPMKVPELEAPVAMISLGGDGWSRTDLLFPKQVLVAGKEAIMTFMGQGQAGGPPTGGMEIE